MVSDYPLMMRLAGRRCIVVGAGPVGMRKAESLLQAEAVVVLIDPRLNAITVPDGIRGVSREFLPTDLAGAFLVFAATDHTGTNQAVAEAARQEGIPVNIADDPDGSDFIVPASFQSGNLSVSVATGGVSPAVAAMVRDDLKISLSDHWPIFLEIAGKLRVRLLTSSRKTAYNQQVLRNLVSSGILDLIAASDAPGIDRMLETQFGEGCSLTDLGIRLSEGSS